MVATGAPVNGFGVGTAMGVSRDAPDLDIAYKLCAYAGRGRLKLSTGRPVLPGRKQVFRIEGDGRMLYDVIARADEILPGRPLLCPVMRDGQQTPEGIVEIEEARRYTQDQLNGLPENICAIAPAALPFPVKISTALRAYQNQITREVTT
jgi:nicotinate phosphoribosyltransferase